MAGAYFKDWWAENRERFKAGVVGNEAVEELACTAFCAGGGEVEDPTPPEPAPAPEPEPEPEPEPDDDDDEGDEDEDEDEE